MNSRYDTVNGSRRGNGTDEGGLPSGVLTGRWAVQTLCAEMGREFAPPR